MFTSIKDTILTVGSLLQSSNEEKVPERLPIDLNAGLEILNGFQKKWIEIHDLNEMNAEAADEVAEVINKIFTKVNNEHCNIAEITGVLKSQTISKGIQNCLSQIKNLHNSFEQIEQELIGLEILIDDLELIKEKEEHNYQLKCYESKKIAVLDKIRSELMVEQAEKEKRRMHERQQVFEEAFHNDLETFKNLGSIPKIQTQPQPGALLEEVQLDLDKNDLESFLES